MLDKMRLSCVGLLIGCAFLICGSPFKAHGQRRTKLAAPKSLLEILDAGDRQCVLSNGGLSKSVSIRVIRLAADGTTQILVRGSGSCLCGAQNCPFWIYRKRRGSYELLLKGDGSRTVNAARKVSHSYRDIVSQSHASAIETIIRTYRFDGQTYQLQRCVSRASYDDHGKVIKVPIDRPCGENTKPNQDKPKP